jgi:hypothetical protein
VGVMYFLHPVGYREVDDGSTGPTWLERELERFGITPPETVRPSRHPTAREARAVLESFSAYTARYRVSSNRWEGCIEANADNYDYACLVFGQWNGDEDAPQWCFLKKGDWSLNVAIVERLARFCGPFVITTDAPGVPAVITPGISLHAIEEQQDRAVVWMLTQFVTELFASDEAPGEELMCPICNVGLDIEVAGASDTRSTIEVGCNYGCYATIGYEGALPAWLGSYGETSRSHRGQSPE